MNGFSKLRNNALGDALEYMKEVEAWGGGVSRYFTACAAAGLHPPTVTEEAGFFKVVFWRRVKDVAESEHGNVMASDGNIASGNGNIGSKKGNIADVDGNIDGKEGRKKAFSASTIAKIEALRMACSESMFFKRTAALKVLKMNPASLSKLFQKMLAKGIIEPVSGYGKGAYRFV